MTQSKRAVPGNRKLVSAAIGVALIHFAVTLVHGLAHNRLEIGLSTAQKLFVGVGITAAPIVAAYLFWKGSIRTASALLTVSMASALVFGIYYHFIAPGADNVSHQLPPALADWSRIFDQTAIGIAGLELLGAGLGLALVLKSFRKPD